MTIKYQGKKFIPIRRFVRRARIIPKLEKILKSGEVLVVDPKGTFFDFKGDGDHYLYPIYGYNRRFPRFLTYLKKIVGRKVKAIRYETTMS